MESSKNRNCPILNTTCQESACAWWCIFAKDCAVPLLAGMFADSEISCTVFREEQNA